MDKNSPKALIKKANDLVEARYHFSIWETRVFTRMVSLVQPKDEDFKMYKIEIKELLRLFNINDNDGYKKIKAVPESLLKKVITLPYTTESGEERFFQTGLINHASIPKKSQGFIELSFHPQLRPYLLQLKEKFLLYDIENVLKISSVYSIRIYELLKQYEKIGKRMFTVENLKITLGIEDKYKLYGHLKKRIILKAQKDLANHTDLVFSFEEVKKGRKIEALTFFIKENPKNPPREIPIEELEVAQNKESLELDSRMNSILARWGLSRETLEGYLDKYPSEYIKERIWYVQAQIKNKASEGQPIKNPAGYFHKMMNEPNIPQLELVKHSKKKRENVKQTKVEKQQLEQQLKTLQKELHEEEKQLTVRVLTEKESFRKLIANHHKSKKHLQGTSLDFLLKSFQENIHFRAIAISQAKEVFTDDFKQIAENFKENIAEVKEKIRLL